MQPPVGSLPFQSTPSEGRATRDRRQGRRNGPISIHALRGEGDRPAASTRHTNQRISIHALRGEGDVLAEHIVNHALNFNPRPPRGGRRIFGYFSPLDKLISIHALRGEGDGRGQLPGRRDGISIHALRGEGDGKTVQFLPDPFLISIHALRGEGDVVYRREFCFYPHFNPRPPRGGRPKS